MKKQQILWNHLQYIDQIKAMKKVSNLLENEIDPTIKIALSAALVELELWSNRPLDNDIDEEETLTATKIWIH